MTDTPDPDEELRVELERTISDYLRQSGLSLEVEIQNWGRTPEHFASLGVSYRGELVRSFRRFHSEADADTLLDAIERVNKGSEAGAFDPLRQLDVETQASGVFNEGPERVALVATLNVVT